MTIPFDFYVMPIPVVKSDGIAPDSTALVSVSLYDLNYSSAYTILYYIVKAKYWLSSSLFPRQISFRDSVDISGYVGNQCGTGTAPQAPQSITYTVSIYQGMNYGTLEEPGTGRTGKTLTGLTRQGTGFAVKFLANCDNPDNSAKVRFRYTASDSTIEAYYDSMTVNAGPPGPVVKYRITLFPDSLLHGDTTVVTVAAVDSNNQMQLWPDTTHLTFSLDSTRFARFISPAGDSVQSPLTRVLYSDAKVGRVRVVADGAKPALPGPKGIQLSVTDGSKNGSKTTFIRPLKFTILTARTRIRPLRDQDNRKNPAYVDSTSPDQRRKIIDSLKVDTTMVFVKLTDGQNRSVSSYRFRARALVVDSTGGHDHIPGRTKGNFITPTGDTLNNANVVTGSDGQVRFTYLSSGFGGMDSLVVDGHSPSDTGTVKVELSFGDFTLLQAGTHYTLTGAYGDPNVHSVHKVNHYGTQNLVTQLGVLADSVFRKSGLILKYNDMSLKGGGPFDITNNWNTPHQNHRQGVNVDIATTDANGRAVSETYLRNLVDKVCGGTLVREARPAHYHVTIQ